MRSCLLALHLDSDIEIDCQFLAISSFRLKFDVSSRDKVPGPRAHPRNISVAYNQFFAGKGIPRFLLLYALWRESSVSTLLRAASW